MFLERGRALTLSAPLPKCIQIIVIKFLIRAWALGTGKCYMVIKIVLFRTWSVITILRMR